VHHDRPDHQLADLHDKQHDHHEKRQRQHETQALGGAALIPVKMPQPPQPHR